MSHANNNFDELFAAGMRRAQARQQALADAVGTISGPTVTTSTGTAQSSSTWLPPPPEAAPAPPTTGQPSTSGQQSTSGPSPSTSGPPPSTSGPAPSFSDNGLTFVRFEIPGFADGSVNAVFRSRLDNPALRNYVRQSVLLYNQLLELIASAATPPEVDDNGSPSPGTSVSTEIDPGSPEDLSSVVGEVSTTSPSDEQPLDLRKK